MTEQPLPGSTCIAEPEDVVPELNPALDWAQLAAAFNQTGRIHIPNILTDTSAQRLFRALEHETPWGLIFNEGKQAHEFETVSAEDHQEMAIAAWERAHSRFQYFYHCYKLLENRRIRPERQHYLVKLILFLTSPQFLQFGREVTGDDTIGWISATATLYKPLDFLTIHDDGSNNRRIAYVLNMTPAWKPDWGGALQFFDRDDHIEEAYLPTFNALNLFRVPKRHSVSQVASFGGLRYSISGWFEPSLARGEARDKTMATASLRG